MLSDLVRIYEYSQLGGISLQETWLHGDIDEEVAKLSGFTRHRIAHPVSQRKRVGIVITYPNGQLHRHAKPVFMISLTPLLLSVNLII